MNHIDDDESAILTPLIPNLERLQHDSRGLIQWVITLNNQERLALLQWAKQRTPWLVPSIQRVPPAPAPRRRRAGRAWR